MMRLTLIGCTCVLALSFGGCAGIGATGPVFQADTVVPPGQAKLVMYRLYSGIQSQCYELIRVNGKDVTTIVNGGYYDCFVPAGKVTITRSPRVAMGLGGMMFRPDFDWPVDLQVESGRSYYVKFSVSTWSMDQAMQTEVVPESKAVNDLEGSKKFQAGHHDFGA